MADGKAGRPTVYQDTYPTELVELMTTGALDCNICAHWDISRDTFYRWLNEKPELRAAHNRGLEKCEAWWVSKGMAGMDGAVKGFSFNAWIAFMNNKFKWAKNAADSGTTNNIQIGNINLLQNKSKDDLVEYIGLKMKDLGLLETQPILIDVTPDKDDPTTDSV